MRDHPMIALVKAANYDLTSAKAKLSELERQIAALDLEPAASHRCPDETCGLAFRGPKRLAEHVYVSHGGPEPGHWQAAEALALEPDQETVVAWPAS